jgi:hypothetical protein
MKSLDAPQLLFGDMSQGVMCSTSHRLSPASSVAHAVNFEFDSVVGEATVRKGTVSVGTATALSGAAYGLACFVDSEAGANTRLLLTSDNGTTHYLNGSNVWAASLTGDTVKQTTRFATFLDRVVRVNGTDACKSWNGDIGAAWEVSGGPLDIGNMPRGKYVIVYKDQLVTAGVSGFPDTVYVSSIPDATTYQISWTSGNRSITVNPDDEGNITALGKVGDLLLIFKDNGLFRFNNRSTDPDRVIPVGCSSQESVCAGDRVLTFWNRQGAWLTDGQKVKNISKRIRQWTDAVSDASLSSVATATDGEHFLYSVGDVTKDGTTYSNVVFRYSISTNEWAVYSYAKRFTFFTVFKDGSEQKIVGATDDADCHQIEVSTAYDDAGTPINVEIEGHQQDFGSRAIYKEITEAAYAYGLSLPGFTVSGKAEKGDWIQMGQAKGDVTKLNLPNPLKGQYFTFRVTGNAPSAPCRFSGLELPKVTLVSYGQP